MKTTWKLAFLVFAAFIAANFIRHLVDQRILIVPEHFRALTYVLVPIVFFLITVPLIRSDQLPRTDITLKAATFVPWAILVGVGLACANLMVTNLYGVGSAYLLHPVEATKAVVRWQCEWPAVVPASLLTLVIIPVMEEIAFRGMILELFIRKQRPALGITISALAFAIYHPNFSNALLAGIVLGFMYRHTRQLGLPIVAHITHNFIVLATTQCIHIDWVPAPIWLLAFTVFAGFGIIASVWGIRHVPYSKSGDEP